MFVHLRYLAVLTLILVSSVASAPVRIGSPDMNAYMADDINSRLPREIIQTKIGGEAMAPLTGREAKLLIGGGPSLGRGLSLGRQRRGRVDRAR